MGSLSLFRGRGRRSPRQRRKDQLSAGLADADRDHLITSDSDAVYRRGPGVSNVAFVVGTSPRQAQAVLSLAGVDRMGQQWLGCCDPEPLGSDPKVLGLNAVGPYTRP